MTTNYGPLTGAVINTLVDRGMSPTLLRDYIESMGGEDALWSTILGPLLDAIEEEAKEYGHQVRTEAIV